MKQIEDRDYTARLRDDGMRNIIKYGIACYKKNCRSDEAGSATMA